MARRALTLGAGNVMVTMEGEVPRGAKLIDLDLVSREDISEGTPLYKSPPTVRGEEATHAQDTFSAGLMMLEAVCGRSWPARLIGVDSWALPHTATELAGYLTGAMEVLEFGFDGPVKKMVDTCERSELWFTTSADSVTKEVEALEKLLEMIPGALRVTVSDQLQESHGNPFRSVAKHPDSLITLLTRASALEAIPSGEGKTVWVAGEVVILPMPVHQVVYLHTVPLVMVTAVMELGGRDSGDDGDSDDTLLPFTAFPRLFTKTMYANLVLYFEKAFPKLCEKAKDVISGSPESTFYLPEDSARLASSDKKLKLTEFRAHAAALLWATNTDGFEWVADSNPYDMQGFYPRKRVSETFEGGFGEEHSVDEEEGSRTFEPEASHRQESRAVQHVPKPPQNGKPTGRPHGPHDGAAAAAGHGDGERAPLKPPVRLKRDCRILQEAHSFMAEYARRRADDRAPKPLGKPVLGAAQHLPAKGAGKPPFRP